MTHIEKTGKVVKVATTPKTASKVQSITAKKGNGAPAPWVGNLQRTADKSFGKSGQKLGG